MIVWIRSITSFAWQASLLHLSWCPLRPVTLRLLCHPAVHSHPFLIWTLRPTRGERVEVWASLLLLLLLPVAPVLVGAAGGADAAGGGPPQVCPGGQSGRVRRRRGSVMAHVSGLGEVVAWWWDGFGFDVDVVVGADREIGACWPADTQRQKRQPRWGCESWAKAPSGGKQLNFL